MECRSVERKVEKSIKEPLEANHMILGVADRLIDVVVLQIERDIPCYILSMDK